MKSTFKNEKETSNIKTELHNSSSQIKDDRQGNKISSKRRSRKKKNRMRLQVTFEKEAYFQLKEVSKDLGIPATEFARQGCNLLAWAYDEVAMGRKIGSINPDSNEFREIILLYLFQKRSKVKF